MLNRQKSVASFGVCHEFNVYSTSQVLSILKSSWMVPIIFLQASHFAQIELQKLNWFVQEPKHNCRQSQEILSLSSVVRPYYLFSNKVFWNIPNTQRKKWFFFFFLRLQFLINWGCSDKLLQITILCLPGILFLSNMSPQYYSFICTQFWPHLKDNVN